MKKYFYLLSFIFLMNCNSHPSVRYSGNLQLANNENIRFAEIKVFKNDAPILNLKLVSPDFKFDLEANSIYKVTFTAPEHQTLETLLWTNDKDAHLDVQLGTVQHHVFTQPYLVGNFNDFDPQQAIAMKENGENRWIAKVPVTNGEVRYSIYGVSKDQKPVVGTMQTTFDFSDSGFYESVIYSDDVTYDIVFTSQTQPSTIPTELKSDNAQTQVVSQAYTLISKNRDAISAGYTRQYISQSEQLVVNWDSLAQPVLSAFHQESDIHAKTIFLNALFDLVLNGYEYQADDEIQEAIFRTGEESPAWSINQYAILAAMDLVQDSDKKLAFLDKMSQKHPDLRIREIACYSGFITADDALATEKRTLFYNRLIKDFPTSQFIAYAKYQYNPEAKVQNGTNAPEFSVVSLDGKQTYSSASFKGKYVMLDFWATWCGPCIQEMDKLHEAYNEFNSKNFALLSLSFDESKEDVTKFRKERYPMPWLHTFVDNGFENELAQRYEVDGIPKPILINPDGKIVAMGVQLRGDNLKRTLARYLN